MIFMLAAPWIPGKRGITKVLFLAGLLSIALLATWLIPSLGSGKVRADILIAMAAFFICGSELGGIASTMASDFDAALARLGVGTVGNLDFAGSVRTDLLNGNRRLAVEVFDCIGCRRCLEICPQGVWDINEEKRADLSQPEACTACRACLVQCPTGAIRAEPSA
jgi:NAD-dependent dihydropyrimidine dehydrogenase PreA subunit